MSDHPAVQAIRLRDMGAQCLDARREHGPFRWVGQFAVRGQECCYLRGQPPELLVFGQDGGDIVDRSGQQLLELGIEREDGRGQLFPDIEPALECLPVLPSVKARIE